MFSLANNKLNASKISLVVTLRLSLFTFGRYRCNICNLQENCEPCESVSADMYHRAARPEDLLEILQLYREYNQGEPLSLSLGLPERHLETNLAIIASFKRLINSSCVLLCCEGTSVLGMAVHYPMPCLPRTQEDILNLTWWQGYPDLAPAIILSDRAVECCSLAVQYRTVMNTP